MPLNNQQLDRKADEFLSVIFVLPFLGLAKLFNNGEYFQLVFGILAGFNFIGFIACIAKDDN